MRLVLVIPALLLASMVQGQTPSTHVYGFRHIVARYHSESVDVLVKSRAGDEDVRKPLFFFCQGSLPVPLILRQDGVAFGTFPFNPDSLAVTYHVVIVGKPSVPLIADVADLQPNYTYVDSTGGFPRGYSANNVVGYYVSRNIAILRFLRAQPWVAPAPLVVAGHSEGSTIALRMADSYKRITHLVYSGGNPMGRMLSIIQQERARETDTDSTRYAESAFDYWSDIVNNANSTDVSQGDSYTTMYGFSESLLPIFARIRIPVLVTYGTRDWSAPYLDFLRLNAIRQGRRDLTFRAYVGTEHNFFPLAADNKPDYSVFNWDRVAQDWLDWLRRHSRKP